MMTTAFMQTYKEPYQATDPAITSRAPPHKKKKVLEQVTGSKKENFHTQHQQRTKLHSEKTTCKYGLGQAIHYRCFPVHNKNKQLLNRMGNLS